MLKAGRTLLALVAWMTGEVVRSVRIVNRMLCWSAAFGRDALGASQVQWRLAGDLASEAEPASAVMAPLVGHRAHGMALGVIA